MIRRFFLTTRSTPAFPRRFACPRLPILLMDTPSSVPFTGTSPSIIFKNPFTTSSSLLNRRKSVQELIPHDPPRKRVRLPSNSYIYYTHEGPSLFDAKHILVMTHGGPGILTISHNMCNINN